MKSGPGGMFSATSTVGSSGLSRPTPIELSSGDHPLLRTWFCGAPVLRIRHVRASGQRIADCHPLNSGFLWRGHVQYRFSGRARSTIGRHHSRCGRIGAGARNPRDTHNRQTNRSRSGLRRPGSRDGHQKCATQLQISHMHLLLLTISKVSARCSSWSRQTRSLQRCR
jgi:hypothetical protein